MGVEDTLFGGTATQQQTTTLSPEQTAAQKLQLENLQIWQDFINSVGPTFGVGGTAPSQVPTFNPDQVKEQEGLRGAADNLYNNFLPQVNDAFTFGTQGVLDIDNNPYAQGYINAALDPVTRDFQTDIFPRVGSAAQAAGAYGGSAHGQAQGNAVDLYARDALNTTATLSGEMYNKGLDIFSSTLGQAGNVAALNTLPAELYGQVGDQIFDRDTAVLAEPQNNAKAYAELLKAFPDAALNIPSPDVTTEIEINEGLVQDFSNIATLYKQATGNDLSGLLGDLWKQYGPK